MGRDCRIIAELQKKSCQFRDKPGISCPIICRVDSLPPTLRVDRFINRVL
jgi:hypothetical protein